MRTFLPVARFVASQPPYRLSASIRTWTTLLVTFAVYTRANLHFVLLHRTSPFVVHGVLIRTTTTQEPCFRKNIKRNPTPVRPDSCNCCVTGSWPTFPVRAVPSRPSSASFRGNWSGICVTAAAPSVTRPLFASCPADVFASPCITSHVGPGHRLDATAVSATGMSGQLETLEEEEHRADSRDRGPDHGPGPRQCRAPGRKQRLRAPQLADRLTSPMTPSRRRPLWTDSYIDPRSSTSAAKATG